MKLKLSIILITSLLMFGCGSTTTTKTTDYDAQGNVIRVTEVSTDASDFATYIASGEGNATDLRGDISKFSLGWNGYGLNWLSISGGRTKAPVNDDSNSAEALEKMAQVVKANKTTLQAGEDVKVNK
jgi:hypothetical protein